MVRENGTDRLAELKELAVPPKDGVCASGRLHNNLAMNILMEKHEGR